MLVVVVEHSKKTYGRTKELAPQVHFHLIYAQKQQSGLITIAEDWFTAKGRP
jgi:hypothetical protein